MRAFIYSALFICAFAAHPVMAQMKGFLGLSVGYFGVFDPENGAMDFRAELRPDTPIFIKALKPWAGIEATTDGTLWTGAGLLLDLKIAENLYFTPSIGAGLYARGNSKINLGGTVNFRSQIELAYQMQTGSRLALAFSHTSNAGLYDSNAGAEAISLYYHIALEKLL